MSVLGRGGFPFDRLRGKVVSMTATKTHVMPGSGATVEIISVVDLDTFIVRYVETGAIRSVTREQLWPR